MTIPSTARKAGPLLGTGAQTAWPFTFKVFAAADVAVTIADSLGVETALVLDTNYSVTLNANQETSPGGTVTYPISGTPLAVGSKLSIIGDLDYDQPLDLPSGGNFSPLALENELDRVVMQIQQLREVSERTVVVPVTSDADGTLPVPEAQKILGWDINGTGLQNYDIPALFSGAVYADWVADTFAGNGTQTVFVLQRAPGAVGNCDVSVDGQTYVPNADFSLSGATLTFTVAPTAGAEILVRYGSAATQVLSTFSTESQTATAGQTVFALNNLLYNPGANALAVYVNGLRMVSGVDLLESNVDEVTFISGLTLGDEVLFISGRTINESIGAEAVSYLPGGTGAVATTAQAKLRESVSVLDFGAVGDGVANDTAAIQAALNSGAGVVEMDDSNYRVTTISIPEGVTLKGKGKAETTITCISNATPIVMNNANDAAIEGVLIIANAAQTSAIIAINATTQAVARCRVKNVQCSGNATDFPFIAIASTSGAYGNWAHLITDVSVSGCGTIFRAETTFANSWINSIQMSHVYADDFIRGVHLIATAGDGCSDSTFFDWATQTSARTQFGALITDVATQGVNRKNSFHDVRWYDLINGGGLGYSVGSNVLDTNVSGLVVDEMAPNRFLDKGIRTLINGMTLFQYVSRTARRSLVVPTNTGLTSAVSGTGTTASLVTYAQLRTGATLGSLARLYSTDVVSGLSQNQIFNVDFGLPLRFCFSITRVTAGASAIGRMQFKTTQADGSLAAKGLGIQLNNYTLSGESYGSALATVALTTLTDGQTYKVEILHYPAQRVEWWVNGVLTSTQTTLSAIPSGFGVCYVHSSLSNVAANDVQMFVGQIELSASV